MMNNAANGSNERLSPSKDIGRRLSITMITLVVPLMFIAYLYINQLVEQQARLSHQLDSARFLIRFLDLRKQYYDTYFSTIGRDEYTEIKGSYPWPLPADDNTNFKSTALARVLNDQQDEWEQLGDKLALFELLGEREQQYLLIVEIMQDMDAFLNVAVPKLGLLSSEYLPVRNMSNDTLNDLRHFELLFVAKAMRTHLLLAKKNASVEELRDLEVDIFSADQVFDAILFHNKVYSNEQIAALKAREKDWIKNAKQLLRKKLQYLFIDFTDANSELMKESEQLFDEAYLIHTILHDYHAKVLLLVRDLLVEERAAAKFWQQLIYGAVLLAIMMALLSAYYVARSIRFNQRLVQEQNELLEQRIDERTHELTEANSRMESLNEALGEQKLRSDRLAAEANAANRAKSLFLASMSHEIRTPLNSIITGSELLTKTELNTRQTHILELVHTSGKTLLELINDVLDFSKIEADELELEEADFKLEELLLNSMRIFILRVADKGIDLRFSFDPACEGEWLGDSTRIKQIVINLLSNAIKFTEHGYIACRCQKVGDCVEINIVDTGIGIARENQEKLFDAFVQSDASITRRFGGTGLGLSICKRLAKMMGGDISVFSAEGDGSSFNLRLPLKRLGSEPVPIETKQYKVFVLATQPKIIERLIGWKEYQFLFDTDNEFDTADIAIFDSVSSALHSDREFAPTTPFLILGSQEQDVLERMPTPLQRPVRVAPYLIAAEDLRNLIHDFVEAPERHLASLREKVQAADQASDQYAGYRVLVAEDVAFNRIIAKEVFEDIGVPVDFAENGKIALDMWQTQNYDLIFMDLHMPEMDGFQATAQIRTREQSNAKAATPIIALTADAVADTRAQVTDAGMDDYVTKPYEIADIVEVLGKYLKDQPPSSKEDAPLPTLHGATVVFDSAALEKRCRQKSSRIRRFINVFFEEAEDIFSAIETSLTGQDRNSLVTQLHSLKGASANLAAERLREMAQALEQEAKQGVALQTIRDALPALHGALSEFKQEAERYLAQLDTPAE